MAIEAQCEYLSGGPKKYNLQADFHRKFVLHCWDKVGPVFEDQVYLEFTTMYLLVLLCTECHGHGATFSGVRRIKLIRQEQI